MNLSLFHCNSCIMQMLLMLCLEACAYRHSYASVMNISTVLPRKPPRTEQILGKMRKI